jgi:hypothetical protein
MKRSWPILITLPTRTGIEENHTKILVPIAGISAEFRTEDLPTQIWNFTSKTNMYGGKDVFMKVCP